MRQRITVEQLAELTPKQQEKLREWWRPADGDWMADKQGNRLFLEEGPTSTYIAKFQEKYLPLLSIGQMIEILQAHEEKVEYDLYNQSGIRIYANGMWHEQFMGLLEPEICDTLFEAVKKVL